MPPQRKSIYTTAILAIISIAAAGPVQAKTCIKWQRVMARGRIEKMPQGKSILIRRFDDFTKKPGDQWLRYGLRDYVADLIGTAKDARALAGITAEYGGGPYDFAVGGTYQNLEGKLRIFLSLSDGKSGKLIAQKEVLFPYPDNREFFTRIAEATAELMGVMKVKYDSKQFDAHRDATSSTAAYESYAKGRAELERYDARKMDKARSYFTETKRIDFRSPLGYQGIVAIDNFLGLYNKQMGRPFSTYYQKAQSELSAMARLAKPAPMVFGYLKYKPAKKYSGPPDLKNRFLLGNVAYVEGVAAQRAGDPARAAEAFKRCVDLVPEDAMAWYHLARAYSMQGRMDEASEAQARAHAINPCLGN